jgi:hypothetical protein
MAPFTNPAVSFQFQRKKMDKTAPQHSGERHSVELHSAKQCANCNNHQRSKMGAVTVHQMSICQETIEKKCSRGVINVHIEISW